MELLAGAAFSWCVMYALLAVFFGARALRRDRDGGEDASFSAACVLAGAYAYCAVRQYHAQDPAVSARWAFRVFLFAPAAAALVLQATLFYTGTLARRKARVLVPLHAATAALVIATALGAFHRPGSLVTREVVLSGVPLRLHDWAPRDSQSIAHLVFALCTLGSLVLLVRSYLTGKREALLACVGGILFGAATFNDVLVHAGRRSFVYLAEHAFAIFALGLAFALLGRDERRSSELRRKGAELRRRAQQLERAYEELRDAQQELVRKEQLAIVGELAAVVSHEVRNPLAIISNAIAGLRRPQISNDDRATLLEILQEETDRLDRLVGDLLRYARPLHVERNELDLDRLLARTAELAKTHARIELEIDLAWARAEGAVAVAPIHGDANLLRQVLDNLVQNACQAMADGGTLTLRAEPAREAGEDGVAIEIGDTGEGIDTQIRSRVGTPFFTTRPSGTGLGLAICDRIVTAHGGTLSIESRSGEGTVVRVFLPAGRTSEAPGVRPATAFVGSAPPGRSKAATDARAASESTPPTIATTFEG